MSEAFSSQPNPLFSELAQDFIRHVQYECGFSAESVQKYSECLGKVRATCGDISVANFGREQLFVLRRHLVERELSVARQLSILLSLKRFLRYVINERGLATLDPELIRAPKRPKREVEFLTVDEVQRFLSVIPVSKSRGGIHRNGLRFRALVEVLLGSAMRISEVLSLNTRDIDFKNAEARVIGKGRKQRTVFFTQRALQWLNSYLQARQDDHEALFVRQDGLDRLKRSDIWRPFRRFRQLARIPKRVTPHLLRHTAATTLLFNGCPVGHIKEILGHERLETTCRYYLGLDHRAAKNAHERFLHFEN